MSLTTRLNPLAAVADQAWLSLLNFLISLALIWGATKEEYGYYLLLVAPLLLVQNVQNALINSPLATFLPAAEEPARQRIRVSAMTMHVYLAGACAVLGFMGLLAYGGIAKVEVSFLLLVGFAAAVVGTIARESQRSFAYTEGHGVRAFGSDIIYGALLLAGLGTAVSNGGLSAATVLALTGIAGVAPLLFQVGKFKGLQIYAESMRQFWSCGRWALPSVIVTWVNLNSYPYFAGKLLSLAAVADIGAARLFLMPVGLIMTAWGNWYRPRISRWFANGNIDAIKQLTRRSVAIGIFAMGLLATILVMAYPWLERLLGGQYQGLKSLVLMWLLYFSIALARVFCMATLMTDAAGYRTLHHITWLALALSLPGLLLLSENGALWVVGVLCMTELLQLLMVVAKVRHYWSPVPSET